MGSSLETIAVKSKPIIQEGIQKIKRSQKIGFVLGLLAFFIIMLLPPPTGLNIKAWRLCAGIAWILTWWLFEVLPIYVTALIPIVLFPMLHIEPLKQATHSYGHPLIFLFLGGFVLALALERWHCHKRIALSILRLIGSDSRMICAGFMLASAFLSMWMSNTATTIMMLPIAGSVLTLLTENQSHDNTDASFAIALLLSIAFAANVGGTSTLIGTPPNAIFAAFVSETMKQSIDFSRWFLLAAPFALCMLIMLWVVICFIVFPPKVKRIENFHTIIEDELQTLGKLKAGEWLTFCVFSCTILSWFTRSSWPLVVSDTTIAVAAAILCFLIPVPGQKRNLLVWSEAKNLPWGILLLFGGGLTIASAMESTDLVGYFGSRLDDLYHLSPSYFLLLIIFMTVMLTELMSNLALVSVFLPIVYGACVTLGLPPWQYLVPVTLSASFAFMLPMGTPPNAIVFASGKIHMKHMIKAGIILNIVASLLLFYYACHVLPMLSPYS